MTQSAESATCYYVLHEKPPYIVYQTNGITYRVSLNGQTLWDAGNGLFIPMPGCPCPEKLATAHMLYFLHRNRRWIPGAVMVTALIVVMNLALMATEGGEIYAAYVSGFSFWMNTALVVLASLCLIAYGISNFKKGLKVQWGEEETPKLLGAGTISISPDVAVFSASETETNAEFLARVEAAQSCLSAGQWLLVIPFRNAFAAVQMAADGSSEEIPGVSMLRAFPVMEFEDAPHDIDTVAHWTAVYKKESWQDYVKYCQDFAARFKPWAKVEKLKSVSTDPIKTILMSALLCLVFALPLSAQKSRQVREYLGDIRYTADVPDKGADVSFVFQRAVLSRRADGAKPYADILRASAQFSDSEDMGRLIGITVDGKPIAPAGKPEQVSRKEAAVSAVPVPEEAAPAPDMPWYKRLPDSTALQAMKNENIRERYLQWQAIEPVADYYMWIFWRIMVILFGIGGALWVFARVSAKDSIRDMYGAAFIGNAISALHIWSKTALFLLMLIPTGVIIVNDSIRAYYTEVFGFWFVVRYAAIYWVWQFVFEKVLPDSPSMGGGGIRGQGNYPTNHRQLNG